ncbi:MAG: DctP family TRAP transporter solute-binding subunit [Deltaproteobacteria bacterium]|jgi:tripartite ATP-independent transporter DctP family solute receptor|nr:DctP family TRAP transporter solute-binding subunit [Deltaproteobacteria bacterium]MBT6501257.1 DctP family TRAP transporter solute-binding subunit [Deltaproteobacteria bacterium]MBT6612823.1 DctP family TRAP transporter solute-binding subunit [Deltaproteobacteria bacterium]
MNKKMLFKSFLTLIMIISFAGMSFAAPKVIKIAHMGKADPFADAVHASAVAFKYLMERRTSGRYEVKIYPQGSLGKQSDVIAALKNNVIQVNIAASIGFFRVFPPASIFFTPYIFKNESVAMEVINGPYGQKLLGAFSEKTGFKGLAFAGAYTWMAITNNKRPIRTLDDIKGLKFRVMDPLGAAMFKSFGATASPIAFAETYTSMQTGVVDGQTNPAFIVANFKFNEVQKYMTLANSQWGYQMMMANQQWFNSLSADDKIALRDSVNGAIDAMKGLTLIQEISFLEKLEKSGMEITTLGAAEMAKFASVARPACLQWVSKVMGKQWADEMLAAIADAEKKLGYK